MTSRKVTGNGPHRKITVEDLPEYSQVQQIKDKKKSVFERLGNNDDEQESLAKQPRRLVLTSSDSLSTTIGVEADHCKTWMENAYCEKGSACEHKHDIKKRGIYQSTSSRKLANFDIEDGEIVPKSTLRSMVAAVGGSHKILGITPKKDKEKKRKKKERLLKKIQEDSIDTTDEDLIIKVKHKSKLYSESNDDETFDPIALDNKKELELEIKRQQLQKELDKMKESERDELRKSKKPHKPRARTASTSSNDLFEMSPVMQGKGMRPPSPMAAVVNPRKIIRNKSEHLLNEAHVKTHRPVIGRLSPPASKNIKSWKSSRDSKSSSERQRNISAEFVREGSDDHLDIVPVRTDKRLSGERKSFVMNEVKYPGKDRQSTRDGYELKTDRSERKQTTDNGYRRKSGEPDRYHRRKDSAEHDAYGHKVSERDRFAWKQPELDFRQKSVEKDNYRMKLEGTDRRIRKHSNDVYDGKKGERDGYGKADSDGYRRKTDEFGDGPHFSEEGGKRTDSRDSKGRKKFEMKVTEDKRRRNSGGERNYTEDKFSEPRGNRYETKIRKYPDTEREGKGRRERGSKSPGKHSGGKRRSRRFSFTAEDVEDICGDFRDEFSSEKGSRSKAGTAKYYETGAKKRQTGDWAEEEPVGKKRKPSPEGRDSKKYGGRTPPPDKRHGRSPARLSVESYRKEKQSGKLRELPKERANEDKPRGRRYEEESRVFYREPEEFPPPRREEAYPRSLSPTRFCHPDRREFITTSREFSFPSPRRTPPPPLFPDEFAGRFPGGGRSPPLLLPFPEDMDPILQLRGGVGNPEFLEDRWRECFEHYQREDSGYADNWYRDRVSRGEYFPPVENHMGRNFQSFGGGGGSGSGGRERRHDGAPWRPAGRSQKSNQSESMKTKNDGQSGSFRTKNEGKSDSFRTKNDGQSDSFRTRNDSQSDSFRTKNDGQSDSFRTKNDGQSESFRTKNDGQSESNRTKNGGQTCNFRIKNESQSGGFRTKSESDTGRGKDLAKSRSDRNHSDYSESSRERKKDVVDEKGVPEESKQKRERSSKTSKKHSKRNSPDPNKVISRVLDDESIDYEVVKEPADESKTITVEVESQVDSGIDVNSCNRYKLSSGNIEREISLTEDPDAIAKVVDCIFEDDKIPEKAEHEEYDVQPDDVDDVADAIVDDVADGSLETQDELQTADESPGRETPKQTQDAEGGKEIDVGIIVEVDNEPVVDKTEDDTSSIKDKVKEKSKDKTAGSKSTREGGKGDRDRGKKDYSRERSGYKKRLESDKRRDKRDKDGKGGRSRREKSRDKRSGRDYKRDDKRGDKRSDRDGKSDKETKGTRDNKGDRDTKGERDKRSDRDNKVDRDNKMDRSGRDRDRRRGHRSGSRTRIRSRSPWRGRGDHRKRDDRRGDLGGRSGVRRGDLKLSPLRRRSGGDSRSGGRSGGRDGRSGGRDGRSRGRDGKSGHRDNKDLEEISDEELETTLKSKRDAATEEVEVKPVVVDILDVDWAALVAETRTAPVADETSHLERFAPPAVFLEAGCSPGMADSGLTTAVEGLCRGVPPNDRLPPGELFAKDSAALNRAVFTRWRERRDIFGVLGPGKSALSTPSDLELRKKLFSSRIQTRRSNNGKLFPNQSHRELYQQNLLILNKATSCLT